MKASIRLGSIRGIEIGIHFSWFFIAALISWMLADGFFPNFFPGWSQQEYWVSGVLAALLLFMSVLIHELAHSFVAQWKQIPVKSITLFLFGGVSNITSRAGRAQTEFLIAAAGPATSLALGVVFILIWVFAGPGEVSEASPLQGIVLYLANVNILVAIFNLIPGFPLDGGRVLRSAIWGVTGSERKATTVASWGGRVVGWIMICIAFVLVLTGNELITAVWLGFIGWFLQSAASSGQVEYEMENLLGTVKVGEIMQGQPETVSPDLPVRTLMQTYFIQQGRRAVPVLDESGRLVGIVTVTDARKLDRDRIDGLKVRDIMTTGDLAMTRQDEPVNEALNRMVHREVNQLLVSSNGHVDGILSRETVVGYFRMVREHGQEPPE